MEFKRKVCTGNCHNRDLYWTSTFILGIRNLWEVGYFLLFLSDWSLESTQQIFRFTLASGFSPSNRVSSFENKTKLWRCCLVFLASWKRSFLLTRKGRGFIRLLNYFDTNGLDKSRQKHHYILTWELVNSFVYFLPNSSGLNVPKQIARKVQNAKENSEYV